MSTPAKKYKFNVTSKKSEKKIYTDFTDFLNEMADWDWDYKDASDFLRAIAPIMPAGSFEKNVLNISFCDGGDPTDPDNDEFIFTITRSK